MSPRTFALISGLLASTLLAASAWAQASRQPMSLAERMAAMRRGWSQGTSQADRQRNAATASDDATQAESEDDDSGSLFSHLFGRRASESPAEANQRPATPTQPRRIASRPGTTSPQSNTSPDGFSLPGLRGSPLPKTHGAASATRPGGPDISQEITGDYPVIRGESAGTAPSRFATRSEPSTTTPRSSSAVTPRQSPSRRTVPHVDPEQLRRELAGSFPAASARNSPAPRTARADNAASRTNDQKPSPPEPDLATDDTTPAANSFSWPATKQSPYDDIESTPTAKRQTADSTDQSYSSAAGAARAFGETGDLGSAFGASAPSRSPRTNSSSIVRPSARSQQVFGETNAIRSTQPAGNVPTVLVSSQTPVITTDIRGPKQILVGREATYRVQLRNQSDTAADGIVATVRIPAWAEVVDTNTTQGMIQQTRGAAESADLQWQLSRLEARGSETLDVRLIPRESRPLELGVSWTLTPVGSRAVVEVQEPKLQMTLAGPDEVLFSEPQLFQLTLSNPGTGPAENVKIELMLPGSGEDAATSHPVGDLPPGATRTVEVELTAREAGKLAVKAVATAAGGLTSDASKEIFCRKPELEVDWRGPETKYAGTPATYFFRVRNPGTAPAENISVQVTLPEGAEFTSASDGQSYDAAERQIEWQIGTLGPGDDNYMELRCVVNTAGANQFQVTAASTSGDLTATKLAETEVIALADLKLEVADPSGPVAVGAPALYEIRVHNRGTNTAKEINIVALFSEGIEPDQVEGAMYTVADGRVTFRTIEELAAGRDVVLKIRAHALSAGTHVFRAEVLCRDLDIKLAAEETTRFYADEIQPDAGREPASTAPGFAGG